MSAQPPSIAAALERYIRYFETLTPVSVADLGKLASADVQFQDPFNDVRGIARMSAVLDHMFRVTDESRFVVTDRAIGDHAAYVRWRYSFRPKGAVGPAREITGMSEIVFDGEGRVCQHTDHWDAAGHIYERVPVLGALLRLARRRLAAP